MEYKVYIDGSQIDLKTLKNPIVTMELENSGSFTFSIYPGNSIYNTIVPMASVAAVWRDNDCIFNGRVLTAPVGSYGVKTVTCAGAMDWLNDVPVYPVTLENKTAAEIAAYIVSAYNNKADTGRKFTVSGFSIEGDETIETYDITGYQSAKSVLSSLVSSFGGYLSCKYSSSGPGSSVTNILTYSTGFSEECSQVLNYGKNIVNFTYSQNFDDLYSILIPIGNDGLTLDTPEVTNNTLLAKYGKIYKTVSFDCDSKTKLQTLANRYMARSVMRQISLEVNIVDLYVLSNNNDPVDVGQYVNIVSDPHGINEKMLCTKRVYTLYDPGKDSVSLGTTQAVFTRSSTKKTQEAITTAENAASTAGSSSSSSSSGSSSGSSSESGTSNITVNFSTVPAFVALGVEEYAALTSYDTGVIYLVSSGGETESGETE